MLCSCTHPPSTLAQQAEQRHLPCLLLKILLLHHFRLSVSEPLRIGSTSKRLETNSIDPETTSQRAPAHCEGCLQYLHPFPPPIYDGKSPGGAAAVLLFQPPPLSMHVPVVLAQACSSDRVTPVVGAEFTQSLIHTLCASAEMIGDMRVLASSMTVEEQIHLRASHRSPASTGPAAFIVPS